MEKLKKIFKTSGIATLSYWAGIGILSFLGILNAGASLTILLMALGGVGALATIGSGIIIGGKTLIDKLINWAKGKFSNEKDNSEPKRKIEKEVEKEATKEQQKFIEALKEEVKKGTKIEITPDWKVPVNGKEYDLIALGFVNEKLANKKMDDLRLGELSKDLGVSINEIEKDDGTGTKVKVYEIGLSKEEQLKVKIKNELQKDDGKIEVKFNDDGDKAFVIFEDGTQEQLALEDVSIEGIKEYFGIGKKGYDGVKVGFEQLDEKDTDSKLTIVKKDKASAKGMKESKDIIEQLIAIQTKAVKPGKKMEIISSKEKNGIISIKVNGKKYPLGKDVKLDTIESIIKEDPGMQELKDGSSYGRFEID